MLFSEHDPKHYIDVRTGSIDDFIASGVAAEATSNAKENALNIALEYCKTNYDYTTIRYIINEDTWEILFWENEAKIASQQITLDKSGKVLGICYAE